jgi:23S rRNA pseudouridine1911/1915/1917 synthase
MSPVRTIFEDEDLLVLDKPSGITVNRSETTKGKDTIQDWLEEKYPVSGEEYQKENNAAFYNRCGIVHRLDKETSGVLIVARNPETFFFLQSQFKERLVSKSYVALVHGLVKPSAGEITVPVGRLPWNRTRFGIVPGGKASVTEFQVLDYYTLQENKLKLTYLELFPQTGRTHQIRVHLKYAGYPIFSDALYAGRKTAREDRKYLSRMFLHASKITFIHPKSGERVTFESKLPDELQQFLNSLSRLT